MLELVQQETSFQTVSLSMPLVQVAVTQASVLLSEVAFREGSSETVERILIDSETATDRKH